MKRSSILYATTDGRKSSICMIHMMVSVQLICLYFDRLTKIRNTNCSKCTFRQLLNIQNISYGLVTIDILLFVVIEWLNGNTHSISFPWWQYDVCIQWTIKHITIRKRSITRLLYRQFLFYRRFDIYAVSLNLLDIRWFNIHLVWLCASYD